MTHSNDDEELSPPSDPSALEAAVQDHPIAALLAAVLFGVVLSKTVF